MTSGGSVAMGVQHVKYEKFKLQTHLKIHGFDFYK